MAAIYAKRTSGEVALLVCVGSKRSNGTDPLSRDFLAPKDLELGINGLVEKARKLDALEEVLDDTAASDRDVIIRLCAGLLSRLRPKHIEKQSLRFGPLRHGRRFSGFVPFLYHDVAFKRFKSPRRLGVNSRLLRRIGPNERGGFCDTGILGVAARRRPAIRDHAAGRQHDFPLKRRAGDRQGAARRSRLPLRFEGFGRS